MAKNILILDFPYSDAARASLVHNLRSSGYLRQALDLGVQALASKNTSTFLLLVCAHTTWDVKNFNLAAKFFERIAKKDPLNYLVRIGHIESYYFAKNNAMVERILSQSIAEFGSKIEFMFVKWLLCHSNGKNDEYRSSFEQIFDLLRREPYQNIDKNYSAYFLPKLLRLSCLVQHFPDYDSKSFHSLKRSAAVNRSFKKNYSSRSSSLENKKILVVSMPKAGTHLVSNVLESLNCKFSKMFISHSDTVIELHESFAANRVFQHEGFDCFPEKFINQISVDVREALSLLPIGAHALSHLTPDLVPDEWREKLNFVAVYRLPKNALCSEFLAEMRLYKKMLPENYDLELELIFSSNFSEKKKFFLWLSRFAEERKYLYSDLLSWQNYPAVFSLRYEDLFNNNVFKIYSELGRFLGSDPIDSNFSLKYLHGVETATKNASSRFGGDDLWSFEALALYQSLGFEDIELKINSIRLSY